MIDSSLLYIGWSGNIGNLAHEELLVRYPKYHGACFANFKTLEVESSNILLKFEDFSTQEENLVSEFFNFFVI